MFCKHCGNSIDAGASFCAACGVKVLDADDPGARHAPADSVVRGGRELPVAVDAPDLYAGFWVRVAAYLLDYLLMIVMVLIIAVMAGFAYGVIAAASGHQVSDAVARGIGQVIGFVGAWLYYALFESSRLQATPGKRALGLRVTDMRGARIGFWRATGRYFGMLVSALILFIGFMMVGWTRRRQALHDAMAGCCVVRWEGLLRIERGEELPPGSRARSMSGWAIALVVLAVGLFLIVPILAAISIPAYQQYVVRSQVDEGLVLAAGLKTGVVEYYSNSGHFPGSNADVGLASPSSITGRYVSSVEVRKLDDGQTAVVVRYSSEAPQHANLALDGKYLALVAQPDGTGAVEWKCMANFAAKYLPSSCRDLSGR